MKLILVWGAIITHKKFYSENVLEALKEHQHKNSSPNAVIKKTGYIDSHSEWYSLEQISSLTGLGRDRLNQLLPELCDRLQGSFKFCGYHNTQKFYSETVLKALKEYQIKNSAPNALSNKALAVSGDISVIQNQTVKQTISTLLDNPDTLQMLLNESLARSRTLGIENKKLLTIIEEQKPKVDWYDGVAYSSNLVEIGTVGKMVRVGARKIFAFLSCDRIIYKKTDDGVEYYVPYADYEKYFRSVPVPYTRGDRKLTRNKLMSTQGGAIWAAKRYRMEAGDA